MFPHSMHSARAQYSQPECKIWLALLQPILF